MTRRAWRWFWVMWLAAFVILDIVAGSDSLSRTLGRLFSKPMRRAILLGLLALLGWHFWRQPDVRTLTVAWEGCE